MATDKKGLVALAKAAKARQAARRHAAKLRAAASADTTEDQVELALLDTPPRATAKQAQLNSKSRGKDKSTSKSKKRRAEDDAQPKKRLRADQLAWRKVNTSSLPGMDAGGGMMMLEELEDVGVEWEEGPDGGRTARFVTKAKGKERAEAEAEDEDEEGGEEEEQNDDEDQEVQEEQSDSDEDQPDELDTLTFEGLDEADLNNADDNVVDEEPAFNDKKLPAWKGVDLHSSLKQGLLSLGFKTPTDIQKRAVPFALEGRDVVGVAETGSGKTLAYALPVLSHVLRQPRTSGKRPLSALILCPTRELALQVSENLSALLAKACPSEKGKPPRVSVGSVIGGLSAHKQARIVERGADVLVATPGRLWDLLKMNDALAASVRALKFLIIDEADRMIETGHFAELERIVKLTQREGSNAEAVDEDEDEIFKAAGTQLTATKARDDMQTFVFSATLSKDLQANLKRYKRRGRKRSSTLEDLVERLDFRDANPAVIDLSPEGGLVATLREAQIECVASDKDLYLYYMLLRYPGRTLVFTGSIDGIRRLIPLFQTLRVPVHPLHSQLQQKQRLRNLDRFRSEPNSVLIATDVAARGLDIPHVDHVVHFNLPRSADAYVHRSGRTARAQNPGFALQLVAPEDRGVQRGLLKALGRTAPPPDMPIEGGFLRTLKERVRIAGELEKAQHASKKKAHDKNWLLEAAEAMDVDIDPSMLSDLEDDPDRPFSHAKASKVDKLKAELAELLAQPLVARGVSARYPTSGSRVIVDDVLRGDAHGVMLGASTEAAFEVADTVALKKGGKGTKKFDRKKADKGEVMRGRQERKDAKKRAKGKDKKRRDEDDEGDEEDE
ncbi:DEAD-domain-containing protein, partial [Cutaneotrichosporon oleaginosum]